MFANHDYQYCNNLPLVLSCALLLLNTESSTTQKPVAAFSVRSTRGRATNRDASGQFVSIVHEFA